MNKRKHKSTKKSIFFKTAGFTSLECKQCGAIVHHVSIDAKSVLCSQCFLSKIPAPEISQGKRKSSGRPPGWHFMKEFVDKDGIVFHRGVEQPNLRGTLLPTKFEKRPRKKRRTKEEILLSRHKKKQAALRKQRGIKLGRPKKEK